MLICVGRLGRWGLRYSAHVKNKLMYLILDINDISKSLDISVQIKYPTAGLSAGCHGVAPCSSMINSPQSRQAEQIKTS